MREPLARLQTASLTVGIAAAVLALFTSVGAVPFDTWPAFWQLPMHVGCFVFGLLAALAAGHRMRWLDRKRWEYASQSGTTSDERKLAHEEAEQGRRAAARSFSAGPLGVACWLAYQVSPGAHPLGAWLLPLTAMAGLGAGFLLPMLTAARHR